MITMDGHLWDWMLVLIWIWFLKFDESSDAFFGLDWMNVRINALANGMAAHCILHLKLDPSIDMVDTVWFEYFAYVLAQYVCDVYSQYRIKTCRCLEDGFSDLLKRDQIVMVIIATTMRVKVKSQRLRIVKSSMEKKFSALESFTRKWLWLSEHTIKKEASGLITLRHSTTTFKQKYHILQQYIPFIAYVVPFITTSQSFLRWAPWEDTVRIAYGTMCIIFRHKWPNI